MTVWTPEARRQAADRWLAKLDSMPDPPLSIQRAVCLAVGVLLSIPDAASPQEEKPDEHNL